MCPSLSSIGACFLGIGIGALSVTSAAVLLPCLTSFGETSSTVTTANNSNFRERRSNGKKFLKNDEKKLILKIRL